MRGAGIVFLYLRTKSVDDIPTLKRIAHKPCIKANDQVIANKIHCRKIDRFNKKTVK